ncbi:MAG TPA: pentapeptide repeat-containing protein, partial [Ktedonobacterales bacterium]|nr:pentapeptide repeat-containing protein [Ktedonobacterales bacterium]
DARWRGVNLAVVTLPPADQLGDERVAHVAKDAAGKGKDRATRLGEFQAAVRANRQLAVALQGQGLTEEGGRFAYRAQLLQQQVLRRQRKLGSYFFARFLDGLAGYGYKPLRGVLAYVLVIAGFAALYALATHGQLTFGLPPSQLQPLTWYEALVLSISSFHGRGFFQPVQSLGDPVAILAAGEAIIGLLIEISFIATFTQRFFGTK